MKKHIQILTAILSISLLLVCMTGCQSTAQAPNAADNVASLESKFTAEQLEVFNQIYDNEHQEYWIDILGEDGVLMNEQSLIERYIQLEVLPAGSEDTYMNWREVTHP